YDDRLFLLRPQDASPNEIARERTASGAIDAKHDRLDVVIVASFVDRLDEGLRTEDLSGQKAVLALARHDRTGCVYDRDLRPGGRRLPRLDAGEHVHQRDESLQTREVGLHFLLAEVTSDLRLADL